MLGDWKKKKTFLNLFDNISKPEADEGFMIRFGLKIYDCVGTYCYSKKGEKIRNFK